MSGVTAPSAPEDVATAKDVAVGVSSADMSRNMTPLVTTDANVVRSCGAPWSNRTSGTNQSLRHE